MVGVKRDYNKNLNKSNWSRNWVELDFYGAMKIKQKAYIDHDFCKKHKDHKWVRGSYSRSGFIWVCHECYEVRVNAFKQSSLKTNGVDAARSKAIRNAEKINEELALKRFDDYDFDLEDS